LAEVTQQLIAPARISNIFRISGSTRLALANIPIGRNGFVDASTNLFSWAVTQAFNSTNATQTILIPASDPLMFYRLRFPLVWSWP